jgi:hygromycin-B 7''-O-kinase
MNIGKITNINDFDKYFQDEVWIDVAKQICKRQQISFDSLKRTTSSDHIVFSIDDSLILKIYRPFRNCFEREINALNFIDGKSDFVVPEIVATGEFEGFNYVLMTQLSGVEMTRIEWLKLSKKEQISFVAKLASGLKQIHQLNAESFENNWSEFVSDRAATFIERQIAHGVNAEIITALPKFIEENLKLVPLNDPQVFMHGDIHFGNLRLSKASGFWQVSGLFDFADSRIGFHEYDFLAVGVLILQGQREIQREFFKAYGYSENDIDESMRKRLMMLTMLYETADLRRYAIRLRPEAVDLTLDELERGIWSFV